MSKIEIQEQYREKIAQAETSFERQMIEAEMKHQLKMLENGVDAEENRRKGVESAYNCVGCH